MRFAMPPLARESLLDALALAFPVDCVGCARPGRPLCGACRIELVPDVTVQALPSGLRVWSGVPFDDVTAAALRAVKQDGRTGLVADLAPALRAALAAVSAEAGEPLVAVPVPTSRAAMRRRGYRVPELLLRQAGVASTRLLVPARSTVDQRALGRRQRQSNVFGSMRARGEPGLAAVVVDDVVTTGATLAEASRALTARGIRVVGAATVAATALRLRGAADPYQTM